MQRILVGVDGSDAAKRAVKFAAHLAISFGAELWLTYVVDGASHDQIGAFVRAEHASIGDFLESLSLQILEEAVESAQGAGVTNLQTRSLNGVTP